MELNAEIKVYSSKNYVQEITIHSFLACHLAY